jgi:hypothetical protein
MFLINIPYITLRETVLHRQVVKFQVLISRYRGNKSSIGKKEKKQKPRIYFHFKSQRDVSKR